MPDRSPHEAAPRLEDLLTLEELAQHFKVSVSTAKKFRIPFTRAGIQRRYHPKLIAKYELEHSTQPKAWAEGTAA